MRYLGIDLGDKRTGLAVGDNVLRVASPVGLVEVPRSDEPGLIAKLAQACDEHLGPEDGVVFGLPVHMDGSEGDRAKIVRAFAGLFAQTTGRKPRFQDERLTSAQADWQMAQSGLTHKQKKRRRDAMAAAAILQDFLESEHGPNADSGSGTSREGPE
ncbi:MAG: Holliday junction resolvase RuvX [Planctomycetota bacterium]